MPLDRRRASLGNWRAYFEIMAKVECCWCSGRGRIAGACKGDYSRSSAVDCRGGLGHGNAAGREGRIHGGWPWGGRMKTVKYTVYFGCPVRFVKWTENLFLGDTTSTNHTFLIFGQFLIFQRTIFSYGLWFMVFRKEAMDNSLSACRNDWMVN